MDLKENLILSQKDRPLLTREEYETKCSKALPILHSEYALSSDSVLSNKTFLEMVDINKVLDLSVTDLNAIIDNNTFSDEERAYIRELRRKAMNKKAAEECRRRKKSEEQHLSDEFESLKSKRRLLMSDKGRLQQEISDFQQSVGMLPPTEESDPSAPVKPEPMDLESSAQDQLN